MECRERNENLEPTYYAKCGYHWPVFFDKGAFVYSEIRFCEYQEQLDCETMEEAEKIVAVMNQEKVCPVCKKTNRWKAMTDFDIANELQLVKNMAKTALNGR